MVRRVRAGSCPPPPVTWSEEDLGAGEPLTLGSVVEQLKEAHEWIGALIEELEKAPQGTVLDDGSDTR